YFGGADSEYCAMQNSAICGSPGRSSCGDWDRNLDQQRQARLQFARLGAAHKLLLRDEFRLVSRLYSLYYRNAAGYLGARCVWRIPKRHAGGSLAGGNRMSNPREKQSGRADVKPPSPPIEMESLQRAESLYRHAL